MMKILSFFPGAVLLCLIGCSSSSNLRKFTDDDIGKEIPQDVAKRFEVKEVKTLPGATASPTQAPLAKKKTPVKVQKEKAVVKVEIPPVRRTEKMPFDVGEKLEYDIRYVGVTAGSFNLEVLPLKEVNSHHVYHLSAHAKTAKLFELIYRVDDKIESFWDYDGLYSHRFTMDLDESKQSRKLIELYDYEKKKSFYWNRLDHVEKGYSEKKEQFDIELWSQDVLSAVYYIRAIELPKEPGPELRYPVVLDGKPWQIAIQFMKKEKIYAGSKDREANLYKLDTYQNGEAKNKDNKIWLSDDEHRYVLRIEAKVKVGSFAIALENIL